MSALLVGALAACRTQQPAGGITVRTQQSELAVEASDSTTLLMHFEVPADYLSKRGRLLISPRLMDENGEVAVLYESIAVDAPIYRKKMYRRERLQGYVDTLSSRVTTADRWSRLVTVPYEQTVVLPEGWEKGYVDALVSQEGCLSCGYLDTLWVASVQKVAPVDTFSLRWITPHFPQQPKLMEGAGSAALQFVMNGAEIDPSMGNNRSELQQMEQALRPVLQDTLAQINSIHIVGMASADGPLAFNTQLAYHRAVAAKQWLTSRLQVTPEVAARMMADVRPEGWEPVLQAMRNAGDADADAVEEVLQRYPFDGTNDDVQEREIRRLPCWEQIRSRYLQGNRRVEYRYDYTLKSFTTDEALLAAYATRPDAFSEGEFFRVAALMPTLEKKIEVYRCWVHYYPTSAVAVNNLAVLVHEQAVAAGRKGETRQ